MYISPEAGRLLQDVENAHRELIAHFAADEAHRRGFRAVYEALESAVGDVDEAHLDAAGADGGWSPARILLHVAEHDRQIEEAARRGVEHMIEHGLEHARSMWQARSRPSSGGSED